MTGRRGLPIRLRIMAVLFVVCLVNYLLRNNLSVALPSLREEYQFTATQLGLLLGGFNVAYALGQIPGGLFGQWLGSRRGLTLIAVAWSVLTALTGLVPSLVTASTGAVLIALIVTRFLLGAANAPLFPIVAAVIARWFPIGRWALPHAVMSSGLGLGQAAIGPLVAMLIFNFGWRASFYIVAPLGLLVAWWWWCYGRDAPEEHAAVTMEELAIIQRGRAPERVLSVKRAGWRAAILNRNVMLLAGSYFCMNYVFYMFAQWLFTYLVEERGFSLLESGLLYALPFVVGAIMAAVGGGVCDRLCRRFGARWGCRLVGSGALMLVAAFLLLGASAANPFVAVALLSLCFGFTQFTEGAYWSAATYAGGVHTATASGMMNTGGNLPGLLAPVVGAMVDHLGWWPTLASGSVFAVAGAVLWLLVRLDERAWTAGA